MDDELKNAGRSAVENAFAAKVEKKAAQKLRAQRNRHPGVWYGLGMSGLIGWSVAIPAFLGAMLGAWRDKLHPGAHSWTLAMLAIGLVMGCLNAWHWVAREDKSMNEDAEDRNE
jgi:ATP synthase protein I